MKRGLLNATNKRDIANVLLRAFVLLRFYDPVYY